MKITKSFTKNDISEKKIVLYGASMYGEMAYAVLTRFYNAKVEAIIDNKFKSVEWTNIPIIRSRELEKYRNTNILVCAANSFKNICYEIKNMNIEGIEIYDISELLKVYQMNRDSLDNKDENLYLYGDIDYDEILARYDYFAGMNNGYNEKIYLPYCVLCITSRCTLKCKDCAAFITKYKNPQDYSFEYVKRCFSKFLDCIDGIMELELMGGEPLLCKELDRIITWCIEQKKIRAIKIITNGTVFPRDDIWEILSDFKIKLVLDDYGKLSKQTDRIIMEAEKRGIKTEIQRLQTWYKIEPIEHKFFTLDQLKSIYNDCPFRTCVGITNSRLYHCNVAGHMNVVNLLSDEQSDFVPIDIECRNDILRKRIKEFLKIDYLKACGFCGMYRRNEIPVADQVK